MRVQSLGQEDPLEEEMATHSSNLTFVPSGSSGRGRRQSSLDLGNGPGAGGEWR